jgi:preprotein translocase subunit Sec63
LTDLSLSLSLSFGTKRRGKKKKMTREDDLYRALGIERTASQEEIRKAYKTTGTQIKARAWKIFSFRRSDK